jgi:hypothetical protein
MAEEKYWFSDHAEWEKSQTQANRVVLSLRSSENEMQSVFIDTPAIIPTGFIYGRDNLERIIDKALKNFPEDIKPKITIHFGKRIGKFPLHGEELEEYVSPMREKYNAEIDFRNDKFSVAEFSIPNLKKNIDCLPGNFQTGNYSRRLRRGMISDEKVILDSKFSEIFYCLDKIKEFQSEKEKIVEDYFLNLGFSGKNLRTRKTRILNKSFSSDWGDTGGFTENLGEFQRRRFLSISGEIKDYASKAQSLISSFGSGNTIIKNSNERKYEIQLNSADFPLAVPGIHFSKNPLNIDDYLNQKMLVIDIEKPLWKHEEEKELIDERKKLVSQFQKNPFDEFLAKRIKDIEEKLVYKKDGIEAKFWEEKYDSKVSRVSLIYSHQGRVKKQYFKINMANHPHPEELGAEVYEFDDEKSLLEGVTSSIQKENPFLLFGHVVAYDTIQLREAARKLKGKKFEIGSGEEEPTRDFVREILQRVKLPGMKVIDTYRLAAIFHQYLQGKTPKGSLKLDSFVNHIFEISGLEKKFEKSVSHEELRELEIKAIQGDAKADKMIDDYAFTDDEVLLDAINLSLPFYLDVALAVKKMIPHVSIHEILFSPRTTIELARQKHFEKNRNEMLFGYSAKEREDTLQIFKKRMNTYRRERLQEWAGVNTSPVLGEHENVAQIYLPIEEWLKEFFSKGFPEWGGFFENIGKFNQRQQFGALQYPKSFLNQTFMPDYYAARREGDIAESMICNAGLDKSSAERIILNFSRFLQSSKNEKGKELTDAYYAAYDNLKNMYRSLYVSLKGQLGTKIRASIRAAPRDRDENQTLFEFANLFDRENGDLISLRESIDDKNSFIFEYANSIEDEGKRKNFLQNTKRYSSVYKTLDETKAKIIEKLKQSEFESPDGLSLENLVDINNQHQRAMKSRNKFIAMYNFYPEQMKDSWKEKYKELSAFLKSKSLQVLYYRSDYLFVKSLDGKVLGEEDFAGSNVKFIRYLPEFITPKKVPEFPTEDRILFERFESAYD